MSKARRAYPNVRMVCAICHRPMLKAAALQGGYPVGPVCAVAAGLVAPKGQHAQASTVTRDTQTLDLFA